MIDSYPIMLCSGKRSGKITKKLSDKSYCATKNTYYYGVKMHMVDCKVQKTIPLIKFVSITPASESGLTALIHILPKLKNKAIFADKAYCYTALNTQLMTKQNTQNTYIYTPFKLIKGQSSNQRQ